MNGHSNSNQALASQHILSMTGFASTTLEDIKTACTVRWEIRSVNAKGLDLRLKLPNGYEHLEPQAKAALRGSITRGAVQASCVLALHAEANRQILLNEPALAAYFTQRKSFEKTFGPFAPIDFEAVALNGRFAMDEGQIALSADDDAILAALVKAVEALLVARASEGQKLRLILEALIASIRQKTTEITHLADAAPAALYARLHNQLALLLQDTALDADKLAQEAALLATKADIREELDRLRAHCSEAEQLLAEGGPTGRKLDFLSQELSREVNTLCAKASSHEITRIGLDLKTMIDQFREQIQNIE